MHTHAKHFEPESQLLKIGPLTGNLQRFFGLFDDEETKIKFVQIEKDSKTHIIPVTKENIAILGEAVNQKAFIGVSKISEVEETNHKIIATLFEVNATKLVELGIKTYDALSNFTDFVKDANEDIPHEIKNMKIHNFSLWQKCQEDIFRTKQLRKEFSDGNIIPMPR